MLFYVANDDTLIVPSHGRPMTRAELKSQHEMYGTVWETLIRTLYSGGGPGPTANQKGALVAALIRVGCWDAVDALLTPRT